MIRYVTNLVCSRDKTLVVDFLLGEETDGATVSRNWKGIGNENFKNALFHDNCWQMNRYLVAHVIHPHLQGSAWQQPDMRLQA